MILSRFFQLFVGSRNQRLLKRMQGDVKRINALEEKMKALDDAALKNQTMLLRERIEKGASLESLLVDAFAVVREASSRVLGLRHFDVQLMGGMVLFQGKIAEMATGEGKTLVATLPAYLSALSGRGVHIITVNDYLAKRDATEMGQVYAFLGLSTGVILSDMPQDERKAAYDCDITYGTNNEFGFDFLRDNMAFSMEERVQRPLCYGIVDEVDSILIDEARTPLIISGPTDESSDLYVKLNAVIPHLVAQKKEGDGGHYTLDEKSKQAFLTEAGHLHVEGLLAEMGLIETGSSLYDAANITLMHHLNAALRAHTLFFRDVDYIVRDNEVVIIDEHTGRMMAGRRWSDGLHQAIEAKESVKIQTENQTLASITFQNYFRMYDRLAGMTGTADTEAYELHHIYGLEVVVVPTNQSVIRDDQSDLVFLTAIEKFKAIIDDIKACVERKQPVLVGTASIEVSEYLSQLLKQAKIKHNVLNAKFHEKEAQIIAEAGRPGCVTIATNMAGRGTDIVLGGNLRSEREQVTSGQAALDALDADWQKRHQTVLEAGGLRVIGTERHESRRIDNQLRGRSGRQGDPGSSRFYLSLEDNLMRIFASDRVASMMKRLGMGEGEAIEHTWVTRAIANAQRKVEARNFDIRKQLLEYDNVANDQRQVIYAQRVSLLNMEDVSDVVSSMRNDVMAHLVEVHIPPGSLEEEWSIEGLRQTLLQDFGLDLPLQAWIDEADAFDDVALLNKIQQQVNDEYARKEALVDAQTLRQFEKMVVLQSLDVHWKDHLAAMDHLRQGINLRGYAQRDPRQEYKREAFALFSSMLDSLKYDVVSTLSQVHVQAAEDIEAVKAQWAHVNQQVHFDQFDPEMMLSGEPANAGEEDSAPPFVRKNEKIGRNQVCPCGSGKKYKHCHGRIEVTT